MKINLKSKLFYFILGIIISGGITAYAATTMLSKDISFVPDNASWQVNNVEDALNDLYKKDTLYLPKQAVAIDGQHGGVGGIMIKSEKYNILTIDSRTRTGVAGTTYWRIIGYEQEDCTGTNTYLLNTTDPSNSSETFDISDYKCIYLVVSCTATNNVVAWYHYYFNGITFLK